MTTRHTLRAPHFGDELRNAVSGKLGAAVTNYVSSVAYAPHGGYNSFTLGNQLVPTFAYNSWLQTANWHTLLYGDPAEDYMSGVLDWGAAPNNNGSLRAITETNDGPSYPSHLVFNQAFTYDKANRLLSATDDGGWSRQFGYDQFGNMWMPSYTGIPPQGGTVASVNNYDPATNRVNGVPYDASGNMTGLTGMTILYDAENRQKIAHQTIYGEMDYLYDGNGQRVEKKYPDTSFGIYVYDAQGQLAAEYYSDNAPAPPCNTCYFSWDHLGSTRLITDQSGNLVTRHDFLPFGEEIAGGTGGRNSEFGQSDIVNQKFTGKERDAETGLDYFGARYLGSALGRWTSPDRINLTSARLLNPTNTLNKYIYGGNNPLKYVDPDGQDITIYYRPPNGNLMDFGHVFLGALDQDTGAVKFLDFYPKGGTDSFGAGPGAFNMGNFQDRARQQFSSLTIQTKPEEAQKVIDFINKLESGNTAGYSAFSNNCTTVCQDALHDLGIDLGDIQPATFWADIFQRYSATALAREQNGIAGMVQNFFQPIRPEAQPGVEYGNPRNFGPRNFDLFNLYLNQLQNPQPKACVSTYDSASGSYSQTCQ